MRDQSLDFLKAVVTTPSPSGFEQPVARVYREYVSPFANKITTDVMGNVTASINPRASTSVMYAGHMDEIGFIVHYIEDDGFRVLQYDRGNRRGYRYWTACPCSWTGKRARRGGAQGHPNLPEVRYERNA